MDLKELFKDVPAGGRYGVVGYPLDYTLSPAMHNAAIKALGLNAVYLPIRVPEKDFAHFLRQYKELPLDGFNVTVPYKQRMEPVGSLFRSVNTVFRKEGAWRFESTDGDAFLADLKDHRIDLHGQHVVILGAGGSAAAILEAMFRRATGPARVSVINRGQERAEILRSFILEKMKSARPPREFPLDAALSMEMKREAITRASLLINATPVGLHLGEAHLIDLAWLHKGLTVYDLVYHRETELMKAAREKKAQAVGGLGMLVHQGARAFEIWFNQKPPIHVMRQAAEEEMKRRASL